MVDAESVRSGRSERSDRSRKSKLSQLPPHVTSQQLTTEEQLKLIHSRTQLHTANADHSLQGNHLPVNPSAAQRPPAPYTMYSWMSPPPGPTFQTFPQHMPYPPVGWPTQQVLPTAFNPHLASMPFNGQSLSIASPQQPHMSQPMQQLTGFVTASQQHAIQPPVIPSHPELNPVNVQHQLDSSYRTEQFGSRLAQDDSAWVENATAVTGATSETGLSGGDVSRFGARYGLAASLNAQSGAGAGFGISGAAAALIRSEFDNIDLFSCSHVVAILGSTLIALSALLSPVLMLLLPHFPSPIGWNTESCKPNCEGYLIGISVKLALLSLASWVLTSSCRTLCSGGSAILPRARLCRTLLQCLLFVVLFAFWLFYTVRIIQPKEEEYISIVLFASSLTDTLLFLQYAGIGLMELRKVRHRYAVHIVRSPDGMSRSMKCGEMSLQRAAVEVLQFYMVEFTAYTPGPSGSATGAGKRGRRGCGSNDSGCGKNGGGSKYKFYDVDSSGALDKSGTGYTIGQEESNGVNQPSASARLYEELELEKRTRKRRMRLLLAVEEAFTHVRRLAKERSGTCSGPASLPLSTQGNGMAFKNQFNADKTLDPYEAAQAVFPTLIRPLQKYMRVTRQQARHPVDMVIDHLAVCLAYGLSPQAFLERFNPIAATPQLDAASAATAVITAKREQKRQRAARQQHQQQQQQSLLIDVNASPLLPKRAYPGGQQVWSIVADRALSRTLADGAIFQLRRGGEISLLCTVRRLPLIRLMEEILEPLEVGRFAFNTGNSV